MKHLYFYIIGTLIFGCTANYDSIQGHWHSTDSINDGYYTLDAEDSTIIFNKYDRYSNRAEYKLVQNDGKLIIPIG